MVSKIRQIGEESKAVAVGLVAKGGLIVYPTDTVYGLGCDPRNAEAVEKLFDAKRREEKPIPVLCASPEVAMGIVQFSSAAKKMAFERWPGALTMVLPLKANLPSRLSQGSGTLGVRVPASTWCIGLLEACGGMLTGTSANISGNPSARTAEDAENQIGKSVDLILDAGALSGLESTIVRFDDDEITVLRQGPVRVDDAMMGR